MFMTNEHIPINNSEVIRSLFPAFEHLRESVLLFNEEKNLSYCNQSCKLLLGVQHTPTEKETATIEQIFLPVIESHIETLNDNTVVRTDSSLVTLAERKLTTVDSRSFRARIHTSTLLGEKHTVIGYVVHLIDLSEIEILENVLSQAKRVETFSLLALGPSMSVLQTTTTGILISPVLRLNEWIENQPVQTRLSTAMTTLTECFDFLISTNISIKVQIKEDNILAIRQAHFLQLIAHLVLHAARFAGNGGEIAIKCSESQPNSGITILIESESHNALAAQSEDPLSHLIFGEITLPTAEQLEQMHTQVATGLSAAQAIATKYRSQIEYQHSTDHLRMRIRLPQSGAQERE